MQYHKTQLLQRRRVLPMRKRTKKKESHHENSMNCIKLNKGVQ